MRAADSRISSHQKPRWRLGLRGRLALAVGAMTLCVVVVAVALQHALLEAERSSRWVTHTVQMIGTVHALARSGADAQTGMRGYLLSGDERFLVSYHEGTERFAHYADELRGLAERTDQARSIDEIEGSFSAWRAEVAAPLIVARGLRGALADAQLQTLSRGEQRMDAVRDQVDALVAAHTRLLLERREANASMFRSLSTLAVVGLVLAVLIATAAMIVLTLGITRSVQSLSQAAEQFAAGDLSRRASVRGHHELAQIAHAWNDMAESLDRRSREQAQLNRLRDMLQAAATEQEAFDVLARLSPACLPGCGVQLYAMKFSQDLLLPAVGWGDAVDEHDFTPEQCWALRSGRLHTTTGDVDDVVCEHRRARQGASACVPLVAQGETVGLLHVTMPTLEVPALAHELAEVLALTMANLRLREVLRHQAIRDALTGLYNRRYLEATLSRELARAVRAGQPLSMLVLDVDHFKRWNDEHGHAGGDALLKELGTVLRQIFRADDVPCRYGGEEFVVLLPGCTLPDAASRAELLRERVRQIHVLHEGKPLGGVSISIGVAAFPEHGSEAEVLFHHADRAMYTAKSAGRDRVVVASLPGAASSPNA